MDWWWVAVSNLRILAFAGSVREQSFNVRLLAVATDIARETACQIDLVHLRDFPMPIYDRNFESANGQPSQAVELKARFLQCDALLLACPEYNASITPLLKNTIDWVSRPRPGEVNAFKLKPVGLLSASGGALGGLRGLMTVRQVLTQLGSLVMPTQFALGNAESAFDENGRLVNAAQHGLLKDAVAELVMVAGALRTAQLQK